jgi:hypothetical protein
LDGVFKGGLDKIPAPQKFLSQIEAELWHGQVEEAKMLLRNSKCVGVTNFKNYLDKHCLLDISSGSEQESEESQD